MPDDSGRLFLRDLFRERFWNLSVNTGQNLDHFTGAQDGWRFQLMGVSFDFTTDATVADRRVVLVVTSGSTFDMIAIAAQAVQGASTTVRYMFHTGAQTWDAIIDGRLSIGLPAPPIELWTDETAGVGWNVLSDIVNLQAGDDIGQVRWNERGCMSGPIL